MISDRLLIILGFVAVMGLAILAVRPWVRRRDRQRQALPVAPLWEILDTQPDGRPTVLAFSTPSCGVCSTAQSPALNALKDQLGPASVRIIEINAAERPHVADAL